MHVAVGLNGRTQPEVCEVIQFLADHGAKLDELNGAGRTPIAIADNLPVDHGGRSADEADYRARREAEDSVKAMSAGARGWGLAAAVAIAAAWIAAPAFPARAPQAPPSGLPPVDYSLGPDSQPQAGVPKGTLTQHRLAPGKFFPGTPHNYQIYVPAQYDREPPDRLDDLPRWQRLRGRQRPRAGGARQSDREARAAADDGDLHRSRRDAGAVRSGAESLRAHLRVRLADAAVRELPDRGADSRGRQDATTSRTIRTTTASPASAPAASARSSRPGIVRISFGASSPGSAASAISGAPIGCRA